MIFAARYANLRKIASALTLLLILLIVPSIVRPAQGNTPIAVANLPADARLSVMTYNVEGLPWPVRFGRDEALGRIATRLRELRAAGRQPHVVMLQEAFSDGARRVGTEAGYRYIAYGPDSDDAGAAPRLAEQIAFAKSSSLLSGERLGKLVGSGLQIMSDYPILAVRHMVFPSYACAGFDCLANKGAVMALIAVPGIASPVAVVDTHLNSRAASGVDRGRSLIAYRAQVDALGRFLQDNIAPHASLIVAGDFNMGKDKSRKAIMAASARRWWNGAADAENWDSLHRCAAEEAACAATLSPDSRYSLRKSKDLQITSAGLSSTIRPRGISVPFGHESDGTMLSDHVGYIVYYDWQSHRSPGPDA